ncbi:MAG: murein biosynthesis integral membrane protein MurJ [Candidatus Eisenbacteria bacterium]|nr:murein biosynthesis integral membrane protein MurJ [Candidatus Eisenbacteria bacterium]
MTEGAQRQLTAATLIWMLAVLASRVAGLFREMVIARMVGADGMTDVYFAAFTIPDFLNYLLAGGALSITFIPIFLGFLVRKQEAEGWSVFSTVFHVTLATLSILLVLGWILAPLLCRWLAAGFDPEQQRLLVRYTRILLPAQLFFFAGGLLGAVQMARGRHGYYAAAALVYNAGIIAGGLLLGPSLGMEGFCWGALAGAFVGHGVLQVVGAARAGIRLRPHIDLNSPAVRQWIGLTLPLIIGQSILLTDEWMQRYFGSSLAPASISWLNYARKLVLVLPAILGQATAVASFPVLSRQVTEGDFGAMGETLSRGLRRSVVLAGLGAVLLIVLNREIVQIIFGRGAFSTSDVLTTGRVLAVMALAVPALVAQSLLARGYYALADTRTPTLIGTIITLAAIPLYGFLARRFDDPTTHLGGGHLGLAWASTLSLVLYGVVTAFFLQRRLDRRHPASGRLLPAGFLGRSSLVLGVTLLVAALARGQVGQWLPDMSLFPALGRTFLVGGVAVGVFVASARLAGLDEALAPLRAVAARFRR